MFQVQKYTSVIARVLLKATIKHLLMLVLLNSNQLEAKSFSFAVAADMRGCAGSGIFDTNQYFRGVCEAIVKVGAGAFMIIPGDVDPGQEAVQWTIEQYLGRSYTYYLVVGNHDAETPADMKWLRDHNKDGHSLPYIVNSGPKGCQETTYSFDYENAHFVIINEYYDGQHDAGATGDIVDALYDWLAIDLAHTKKPHIFVIGHEPAFPQPDVDNGRERHVGDSLDEHPANRDRFWKLLSDRGVLAYICGHTHGHSAVNIDGVWQIDVGHARGKEDTGAPSTFLIVQIAGDKTKDIKFTAYREVHDDSYDYDDIIYRWSGRLAVTVAIFQARVEAGEVILTWQTESELMNQGFIIERRENKIDDWEEIASYKTDRDLVGDRTACRPRNYQYIDPAVMTGSRYDYRLAQVDYDGQVNYHGIVEVTIANDNYGFSPPAASLTSAYPNPFNQGTWISYVLNERAQVQLFLLNLIGRKVKNFLNGQLQDQGSYAARWDGTNDWGDDLPSGMYLVILKAGKTITSEKLVLLR